MRPAIEVSDLSQHYGEVCALDAVSFTVQGPGVTALLGRNGAGKSTLLHVLAGIASPHRGAVRVAGRDAATQARDLRASVGFAPEHPALDDHTTARAHLTWLSELRGCAPDAVARALTRCDLDALADARLSALSHGQRQRVGLASAILHEPPVLLLDEPTTGLDPAQLVSLRALLAALADDHTIIISTHMLHEARALATSALVLERGRLLTTLQIEPSQRAHDPLEAAFLAAIEGAP
jgi:ABC-2 type transport system ATP-binding protein